MWNLVQEEAKPEWCGAGDLVVSLRKTSADLLSQCLILALSVMNDGKFIP
jgi:hypothetical protein